MCCNAVEISHATYMDDRLHKMDSIFDTQNDINNIQYMKEKLIDLIIDHFNEYNSPPKTTLEFYKFVRLIGKGAFSKVHLAINILTE